MYLQTKNSILRPWSPGDAGSIVRHANNPRVAVGMRDAFPDPYTPEDAHRFIERAGLAGNIFLAIEVGAEAVGGIGIHFLDDVYRHTGEIGYWLSASFWGRGITTEAVRTLVPAVFNETDLVRIQAGIFADNTASARVLEKCGFVREAVHRDAITKKGVVMDEIVYAILKHQDGNQTGNTRLP